MEGFLLQARNIHLFIPVFLIAVAYSTISTLGYSTVVKPLLTKFFHDAEDLWGANPVWPGYDDLVVETLIRAGHLVAAGTAYLLITTFTIGPAVLAFAVFAAVAACSGERSWRSSSSHALVRMLLAGGDGLKGPFGTALLGHVLHAVAYRGTILVLGFYIALFLRYTSPVLLSMELLVFLLGHLFALYMEVVCTLAVVVSAAEPAGCFYGVRALRQAWWIMAEKTTLAVILVFVRGAVKVVVKTISIRVVFVYRIHYYYTVAYAILSGFVYISLCAALQLWFVCATTIYYYQCRQRKDSYYCSI
jgi:hypothetical protein